MAWSELSSIGELKHDIPSLTQSTLDDSVFQQNIDDAKLQVYDDLSKWVDWDEIEDMDLVPRVINRLSRYKSAELTIVRGWQYEDVIIATGDFEESISFLMRSDLIRSRKDAQGEILYFEESHRAALDLYV